MPKTFFDDPLPAGKMIARPVSRRHDVTIPTVPVIFAIVSDGHRITTQGRKMENTGKQTERGRRNTNLRPMKIHILAARHKVTATKPLQETVETTESLIEVQVVTKTAQRPDACGPGL